ncbi:YdeI/OmpD-associated family protein [Pedobacter psychroterrae]|uniref:YdeI/OmpD-associated family protein n=1 Tax=Pedobacter psychroterrae TaxID=2530453 RepID=UPI001CEC46E0|nr:YdeI/OmpD-associated family protein [Pedobacter psychroterrae]
MAQLIEKGLMTDAGYLRVDIATQNGSWTILDFVDQLIIPVDLNTELKSNSVAGEFFESLSKSPKKAILQWLVLARRTETRQRRIAEIVKRAAQKLKPKHLS